MSCLPSQMIPSITFTRTCSHSRGGCPVRHQVVLTMLTLVLMWTWLGQCDARRFMERPTGYGTVRGLVETVHGGGKRVEKYLGIPYARPPLGNLRFERIHVQRILAC
ncbi:hypothetical protein BaRGS_00023441 [Batillaria attramentaria]|uniref:Carboxylesterase type B domain-containing protein n=1 Tax=Batillaria attramentaria TaxID=370345 RepID=A0ABD0KEA9_9CAEN